MSYLSIITSYLQENNKMIVISLLYDDEENIKEKIKLIKNYVKPLIEDGDIKSRFFSEFDMQCLNDQKYPLVFEKIFDELDNSTNNYYVLYSEFDDVVDVEEIKNKYIVQGCKLILRYLLLNNIEEFPYDLIFPKNYARKQAYNQKMHISLREKLGIGIFGKCEYEKIENISSLKLSNLYKQYITLVCKNEKFFSSHRIIKVI